MPMLCRRFLPALFLLLAFSTLPTRAQSAAAQGSLEHITVHGRLLEGNLDGDSPDRKVAVYLPPSYNGGEDRRYPVVYLLHGFTGSESSWYGDADPRRRVNTIMDHAIGTGASHEMILVMPDAHTRFGGSFYSQSITTGDWENFIATELVAYIDSHYRTIPRVESRGLAGHSMGGYGTLRIGIKHPDVFSAIYALSPCCTIWGGEFGQGGVRNSHAETVHTDAQVRAADFNTLATLAVAAAWSPYPKAKPFFLDLPMRQGVLLPTITAKWSANGSPVATLTAAGQHIADHTPSGPRRIHAIAFMREDPRCQQGVNEFWPAISCAGRQASRAKSSAYDILAHF